MVRDSYDAVVVGAGGDGPVTAWKLAEAGLSVLVLEAGPFYGNEQWPRPNEDPGGEASSSAEDLSGDLLDEQFTTREFEMITKLVFGPADHERGFWFRKFPGDGAILQCAGVGGTTLHYTGCHPRAYPASIDEQGHWPIEYADLIPYYQEVEEMCDVTPAPVTAKEELFFRGAADAGWELIEDLNVTEPGYRPQPNAIRQPDEALHVDAGYEGDFTYPDVEGDTLALGDIAGNPHPRGAPYEEKAKRASNVSFVPPALRTGNVTIRPNAFVTDVITVTPRGDTPTAIGVEFRDTWSGSREQVDADVVVLAAGAIETPRLWLNADLPANEWVGRGLTIHFGDNVMGLWDPDDLEETIGSDTIDQHEGQDIAARFDYPGVGMLQTVGTAPGIGAILGFGASASGFAFQNDTAGEPWDTMGRLAGTELKRLLSDYRRMLQILVVTDDRPHQRNGVTVAPGAADEHGPIPIVNYEPSEGDRQRRDELARIAADILREAGASHVHRSDSPPTALHVHSTMRMGEVVDEACEAHDVDRLFVADHSVLANGVGGANPTNTGQALAARTGEKIVERHF
ncbi:GMC family oxidoreductase [Halorubrum sp. CBA1229]|jgi:choline dehydrogenase-like flavoprotein|uniref:GMC oxidoreductase n=1 Tax=Halorubrum sp. CBA1229 TaxID=1853699 RepID=UPI000F4135A8|nr:GMC family oxidoreductase [Halorubrum sp. CBA1229]QKY15807.1 GMC family oxidoreductase [Halorubrum sp. CBA1229]